MVKFSITFYHEPLHWYTYQYWYFKCLLFGPCFQLYVSFMLDHYGKCTLKMYPKCMPRKLSSGNKSFFVKIFFFRTHNNSYSLCEDFFKHYHKILDIEFFLFFQTLRRLRCQMAFLALLGISWPRFFLSKEIPWA